jgi:hypothetical protein
VPPHSHVAAEGKVPIRDFEEALIADLEPKAIRGFQAKLAKQLYQDDSQRERKFGEDLEAAVNGRRETVRCRAIR